MTKIKPVPEMTMRELKRELVSVQEHIDKFSYGSYELNYEQQLLNEIAKRERK